MKRRDIILCIGMLALFALFAASVCPPGHADNGGYVVRPMTPEEAASYRSEPHDDMQEVSFWELPLWVQMMYLSGAIGALLVALKLAPFAFLKLKGKLANKNRDSIYRHISDNPGCTVSDISKRETMNVGSVRYHVDQLRDARRIVQVKIGKFMRLFRNSGAYDDREIVVISALHLRTSRAILFLIRDSPGLSNKQIAERLEIKESMAHTYLSGLLKDEIIRYEKNSQQKMYYLESDVEAILVKVTSAHAGQNNNTAI
jgi:predicted transcriptional regulator